MMVKCDGLGHMAGFAGLGRDVSLARWLDRKWASERENVGGDSEGETVRGVQDTRRDSASSIKEGRHACPYITPG